LLDEGAGPRRRVKGLLAPESDIGIIGETADRQEAVEVSHLANGGLGVAGPGGGYFCG